MAYSYRDAHSDAESNRSSGYLVYDTETGKEYGIYITESEAKLACENLNGQEPRVTGHLST